MTAGNLGELEIKICQKPDYYMAIRNTIVLLFSYGEHQFDAEKFPDPAAMVNQLHSQVRIDRLYIPYGL